MIKLKDILILYTSRDTFTEPSTDGVPTTMIKNDAWRNAMHYPIVILKSYENDTFKIIKDRYSSNLTDSKKQIEYVLSRKQDRKQDRRLLL